MTVQAFVQDEKLKGPLVKILERGMLQCHFSKSTEELLECALLSSPKIVIIQDDAKGHLRSIDLIRDLRDLFGAMITIVHVGTENPGARLTALISAGADNFFAYPFDEVLLEDFLFKSTKKEVCRAFKYRNVPSGETPIEFKLNISIIEINAEGLIFESSELITNGMAFVLDLHSVLELSPFKAKARVLESVRNTSGGYTFTAEFFDISDDLRKRITFKLKGS